MEDDLKPYMSSSEALPQYVRRRNVPDVPEDVDYMMEHLNDPNIDLKKPLAKAISLESLKSTNPPTKQAYAQSDLDVESSDRYSAPSRAGSRDSTVIEFDECVNPFSRLPQFLRPSIAANLPILKCERQSPALTILSCRSTPSACKQSPLQHHPSIVILLLGGSWVSS